MLAHMFLCNLLRAHVYRGERASPGTSKPLPKMASESDKNTKEKVSQIEDKAETKNHRGIPEALFLVSIYRFVVGELIFAQYALLQF